MINSHWQTAHSDGVVHVVTAPGSTIIIQSISEPYFFVMVMQLDTEMTVEEALGGEYPRDVSETVAFLYQPKRGEIVPFEKKPSFKEIYRELDREAWRHDRKYVGFGQMVNKCQDCGANNPHGAVKPCESCGGPNVQLEHLTMKELKDSFIVDPKAISIEDVKGFKPIHIKKETT